MEFVYTSIETKTTSAQVYIRSKNIHATLKKLNVYFIVFFSDIEIARSQEPKNIVELAKEIGLVESEVILYGNKKAKISTSTLDRLKNITNGNYVVVTGYGNICTIISFFVSSKVGISNGIDSIIFILFT